MPNESATSHNLNENNQNNAKELWKTIKSIYGMNKQSKRVSSLNAGEHLLFLEGNEQMASEFNSHFTSIADQLRSLVPRKNLHMSCFDFNIFTVS